jgi:cyclic pyranopterin monophosphate synthase
VEAGTAIARSQRVSARSRVTMKPETVQLVVANELKKGDVLGVARYAGVHAARGAPTVLHAATTAPLGPISVEFELSNDAIGVHVVIDSADGTNAAPHALAAASVAALTIYDMCKAVDRTMVIDDVSLAP